MALARGWRRWRQRRRPVRESELRNRQSVGAGFTLLEVAVALGLLGVVLATALELLGIGLRSAGTSADYTDAVLLARQKLAQLSVAEAELDVGQWTTDGKYRWVAQVVGEPGEDDAPARLRTLRVVVEWDGRGGQKQLELVTLRPAVEQAFAAAAPLRAPAARRPPPIPRRERRR
jgi:prepilin-type N-terminal cleavage/methylation domain-containing protein